MDCKELKEISSYYLENSLEPAVKQELEAHLGSCSGCQKELAEMKKILDILHAVAEKELPADFTSQLHRRLLEVQQANSWTGRIKERINDWFSINNLLRPVPVGVFATFLVLVGIFYYVREIAVNPSPVIMLTQGTDPAALASFSNINASGNLKLEESAILRFKLNSSKALEGVNIEIELPEGLSLAGNGNADRSVSWQGNLEKGENIILVKVKGKKEGVWEVKTKLQKGRAVKEMGKTVKVVKI